MKRAKEILKKYYGYDSFRPLQEKAIESLINGNSSVVLMPTGGGKSVIFQVAAMVREGVGVVISPLIALMKDQVEGLKSNGIEAEFINSSQTTSDQNRVMQDVLSGKVKLLYISPEKLLTRDMYYLLKDIQVALFAIDEAHCISAWGHDFRPEYTKLAGLIDSFNNVPTVALTATADRITRDDIVKQLNLKSPEMFIDSFDRPNLSLNVMPAKNRLNAILDFINLRPGKSGIIYCLSRKQTEKLAESLNNNGIIANFYHAGLSASERSKVQTDFITDRVPIICATIAFGMGIDKSNVRWVIHYNLPKNIENYYQEIGRAGRDGMPADTLLFYNFQDVILLRSFISEGAQQEIMNNKLDRMQQYADSLVCRRRILLNYFNEPYDENCGNCDVCKSPPKQFDGTVIAQKALSAITRLKEQEATGMVIDVLRGSHRSDVLNKGYNNIKTFGAGRDISAFDWKHYIMQLVNTGLVDIAYDRDNALQLTELSTDVLYSRKKVMMVHPAEFNDIIAERKESVKPKSKSKQLTEELFEELRVLRRELAVAKGIAPYMLFSDATLTDMATKRPVTPAEMKNIEGVSEAKYNTYGSYFLDGICKFVNQKMKDGRSIKGGTYIETWNLYQLGLTPDEISKKRKLNLITVYSHIAHLFEKGYNIDIYRYVRSDEVERVKSAVKVCGDSKLKDIYIHLNEEISYEKIRLSLSFLKKTDNGNNQN
jgi:ATP-dependent DNA helicase RecQ